MGGSQIWNQIMTRRNKTKLFFFFLFFFDDFIPAKLSAPRGIGEWRNDLTCRTTRPCAARRVEMDAIILSNLTERGNTARGLTKIEPGGTARVLNSEGGSAPGWPAGDVQPREPRRHLANFWLDESRKHKARRGHMVSAGFRCKPGATGTNSPAFVTEI